MIYDILSKLNIKYEEIEHEAVYTVEEAKNIETKITGIGCKNLFLTNHNNKYYLYILEENKKANIKELKKYLKEKNLFFANELELKNILNLERGSVTPLGIINDINNQTEIIIDKDLVNKKILCHPNTNTKTISIDYSDLIKLIESQNHVFKIF